MGATIKDIARLAQVSHTTVSRVLNNNPHISAETKEKVLAIAKQLHYVPNFSAKNLALDKSHVVGMFFSTLGARTSPCFFQDTIRGVCDIIPSDYYVAIKGHDSYQDYYSINSQNFDGIILMSQNPADNRLIYHINSCGIPLVVLNRYIEDENILNIVSNDYQGAVKIVKYLVSLGHREIAHISGFKEFKSSYDRQKGYVDVLANHALPVRKDYIIQGDYSIASGYHGMKKILTMESRPTALFCANDDMAFGAIRAVLEAGLCIPQDISIVGFDDILFSQYTVPALTTIKRDMYGMGKKGASMLLAAIDGHEYQEKRFIMDNELVIRQSTTARQEDNKHAYRDGDDVLQK
jgi:LacI family transcriptional regulator